MVAGKSKTKFNNTKYKNNNKQFQTYVACIQNLSIFLNLNKDLHEKK